MRSSARQTLGNSNLFQPFGNTSARNALQDDSSGSGFSNIIFLGCGDLENMLKSLEMLSPKKLHIHLNDSSPSVLACNILILKVVSSKSFNTQDKEHIQFLWDLWYNKDWLETTRTRFLRVLKELLVDEVLPENICIPNKSSLKSLRQTWSAWNVFSSKSKHQSEILLQKVNKERSLYMLNSLKGENAVNLHKETELTDAFFKAVREIAVQWELNIGFENLEDSIRKKIYDEARLYFENGSCRIKTEAFPECANPTLLDPITHCWQIGSACPFEAYLPQPKEELITSIDEEILIRTCQKILKRYVDAYRRHMKTLKISIHLEDVLEFCCTRKTEKFDVIFCSNIVDDIGLVNVIIACSESLSDNPNAILCTETTNWIDVAPSVMQYVEKSLCTKLSMIPTVYGLQLLDYVELGDLAPNIMRHPVSHSVNLSWMKAPHYRNVPFSPSPTIDLFLKELTQKCFLLPTYPYGKSWKKCLLETSYTPLTFNYIVNNITRRVGGDHWIKESSDLKIPHFFRLANRTAEAWKNGEVISILSFDIHFRPAILAAFKDLTTKNGRPILRLVLAPNRKFVNYHKLALGQDKFSKEHQEDLSATDVHFIDNFQFSTDRTSDGEIGVASISFLLILDHGLEETHFAFVIDLVTGLPLLLFETMNSMRVDKKEFAYPFECKVPPTSFGGTDIIVTSCIESEKHYDLKVEFRDCKKFVEVKAFGNRHQTCQSSHELTLALLQPRKTKPFTITFPYPIEMDDRADLMFSFHQRPERKLDCSSGLQFRKAIREPLAFEFRKDRSKISQSSLKPWDERDGLNSVEFHLDFQYVSLYHQQLLALSPLNRVREIIRFIFTNAMTLNTEYVFTIESHEPTTLIPSDLYPVWYIRVHHPILTSPTGIPMAFLSAMDVYLSYNLTCKGRLNSLKTEETVDRLIFEKSGDHNPVEIGTTYTREEMELFRYVLRLNSTKIEPSIWQKNNLPLNEVNNIWLATFVSPLYLDSKTDPDFAHTRQNLPDLPENLSKKKDPVENIRVSSCAMCQKISQNLKRCSRCRVIRYCSAECQRADWAKHKTSCIKK